MQAIILAAGYATRMYPLTENTPKALLPLRGKPMIDYIVEQLNNLPDVQNIYVVSNSKFYPHFCEWAKTVSSEIPIEILDDGTTSNENRRGAVGDVHFAITEKDIDDELIVIAGDNYFTYDLREQLALFRKTGCDTLCGKELNDPEKLKSFGIAVLAPDGKLLNFEEKPQNPKSNIVIYAAYFFQKQTTALVEKFLQEGNSPDNIGSFPQWLYKFLDVYTYKMNGECYDIGTIEMYNEMNK
ncbi:MAG: nucleotidyltransferase family protein [Defluviitaleaceae bacterium]|nr:nucleotidyltransferase family protein [Defluviitaleaceae bacterium]MCL2263202.1 nucleotidyltransferase family protein [Defluviitaleaceae bacterium]